MKREEIQQKEKIPRSVLILRYTFLALTIPLFFLGCYECAFYTFLGHMFFSDWAWETIYHCK